MLNSAGDLLRGRVSPSCRLNVLRSSLLVKETLFMKLSIDLLRPSPSVSVGSVMDFLVYVVRRREPLDDG